MSAASSNYLLGQAAHERRRLTLQGAVLNPLTESFLLRAGLSSGMKVLDLGCGTGEVAMIAARLVAPAGHVTGIDIDPTALETARQQAVAAGFKNIGFQQMNVDELHSPESYDAVIGRLILIHTKDPLAVLRNAVAQLRSRGIVAFHECDLSFRPRNHPPKPQYEKSFQLAIDLFQRAAHADIGLRLFSLFHEVGLAGVESRAEYLLNGGPDCPFYEWVAETLRSMAPKLEALGLATAAELDLDSLAARIKQEAIAIGGCLAGPVMVATSGRKL